MSYLDILNEELELNEKANLDREQEVFLDKFTDMRGGSPRKVREIADHILAVNNHMDQRFEKSKDPFVIKSANEFIKQFKKGDMKTLLFYRSYPL